MASLYDLKVGQEMEFRRVLSSAGFTAEHVERVIRQPRLAEQMFASVGEVAPNDKSRFVAFDPFVDAAAQLRNIFAWNKRYRWGFSKKEISAAYHDAPSMSDGSGVMVLVPYLEDEWVTFRDLWTAARRQQRNYWHCKIFDRVTPGNLRLLDGIVHPKRCLRWELIDLGANRNRKAVDVRDPKTSPHAGILAAAAHHPSWAQALQGSPTPHIVMSGYQCDLSELDIKSRKPWDNVPGLDFRKDENRLALCGCESDYAFNSVAIPVIRHIVE